MGFFKCHGNVLITVIGSETRLKKNPFEQLERQAVPP